MQLYTQRETQWKGKCGLRYSKSLNSGSKFLGHAETSLSVFSHFFGLCMPMETYQF